MGKNRRVKHFFLLVLVGCAIYVLFGVFYTPSKGSTVLSKHVDSEDTITDLYKYNAIKSKTIPVKFDQRKKCLEGTNNCIRVFDTSVDYSSAKQIYTCVDLRIRSLAHTPICVYDPATDIYVSNSILNTGSWEHSYVLKVLDILSQDTNLEFVDLGCNVGVFTVAVAKHGRRVTALDANRKNLEMLTTSLKLGNITKMVTVVWNALSDIPETVGFKEAEGNIGGLQMVSDINAGNVNDDNGSIAIMLDDLIPMFRGKSVFIKMDIEAYELKAMLGGKKFFEEVDIKFLFMEWIHHKHTDIGSKIVQFMTERGYTPFRPSDNFLSRPLQITYRNNWPSDIIWIKDFSKTFSKRKTVSVFKAAVMVAIFAIVAVDFVFVLGVLVVIFTQ